MMSAKIATPDLLKITVFWNKGYDVIIPVDDVTNKILSRDSNYIVDVLMWPKFGNCSISMREVITTSILYGFDQKNHFIWGVVLVQVQYFGTGTKYKLEIVCKSRKKVKTKSQKVLGANFYLCRSYRGKTGRGGGRRDFLLPSSWIGLKVNFLHDFESKKKQLINKKT